MNRVAVLFCVLLSFVCITCKKDADLPVSIKGESSIQADSVYYFQVAPVSGATYAWKTQAPLTVLDGQGSYKIKVMASSAFSSASICVDIHSVTKEQNVCNTVGYKPGWRRVSAAGIDRQYAFSFVIGNTAYVSGGGNTLNNGSTFTPQNDSYSFSDTSTSLHVLHHLPVLRYGGISFTANNQGYVGFGVDQDGNYCKDLWRYDPASDSWTKMASCPGPGIVNGGSFVLNNTAYILTGTNAGYNDSVWAYAIATNSWSAKHNTPFSARASATCFSYANYGYVIGGESNTIISLAEVWKYDPAADSWQSLPDFPGTARNSACSFVLGNTLYYGSGGDINNFMLYDYWTWNLTTNVWQKTVDKTWGITSVSCFAINNKGYAFGGWTINPFTNVALNSNFLWEFTP